MKKVFLVLLPALFLIRCAAYKELKPDPEITFLEKGFIEIKDGDENFELKKDKKYFMVFPAPAEDDYYLVLEVADRPFLDTYFTKVFDDGKGPKIEIPDESSDPDRVSVYPIDRSVQKFYWVVEQVRQDMPLDMDYRYVPRWRYKFETKYSELQETITLNTVNRSPYRNIGSAFDLEGFDYTSEIAQVKKKFTNLVTVQQQMDSLKALLPDNIVNSEDEAFKDYTTLKEELEEEIRFQQDYVNVLTLFKNETESRNNPQQFAAHIDDFLTALENRANFPDNVKQTVKQVFGKRLPELTVYFDGVIGNQKTAKTLNINVAGAKKLYEATGNAIAEDFKNQAQFVETYNAKVKAVEEAEAQLKKISSSIKGKMPSNTFFSRLVTQINKLQYNLPSEIGGSVGKYRDYACVGALNKKIRFLRSRVKNTARQYREADLLVPQINAMKNQKDYRGVRRLLNQNSHLVFLKDLYKGLDQLSLDDQSRKIKTAMKNGQWMQAETYLKGLHYDQDFLFPQQINPKKKALVAVLEDSLFANIEKASLARARKFADENIMTTENVEELYNNPVFEPVYLPTFSSRGKADLDRRIKKLNDKLIYLREREFPERAIKQLYSDFIRDPNADGVYKARAVVVHGKHYTGEDRSIRNRVAECDPWASKWITKPKAYRKIFALPTTSNERGNNVYVFRLNIRIPSEAKFPVYDINIKLPKTVAKNAASEQWYERITLNKKPVKNEGRFTITAPTAANNYECQIGPVRMMKDADNVLEVRFKHPSFKAFEVSVMAQKPIIKKHQ